MLPISRLAIMTPFTEIVGGVTIVHTGKLRFCKTGVSATGKKFGIGLEPDVRMYDSKGNLFYSDYSSLEEANEAMKDLLKKGITSVVGPAAPIFRRGKYIPNHGYIGVYTAPNDEHVKKMQRGKSKLSD